MTSGVYAITNTTSGRAYVGSSINVRRRWSLHRSALRAGRHANRALQADWDALGEAAFKLTVIEPATVEELGEAEVGWIERLRDADGVYNVEGMAQRKAGNVEGAPATPVHGYVSTSQAAKELGIDASRVRRLAASRGLGTKPGDLIWVFTEAEVEAMRDRKPGRPRKRPAQE